MSPVNKYPGMAREIASHGRYGDSILMHVNPREVEGLASLGPVTTNPVTGLPEAFLWAPLVTGMLLGGVTGGLTARAQNKPFHQGMLMGAATGAITGGIAGAVGGGAGAAVPPVTPGGEVVVSNIPSTFAEVPIQGVASNIPSTIPTPIIPSMIPTPIIPSTIPTPVANIQPSFSPVSPESLAGWVQGPLPRPPVEASLGVDPSLLAESSYRIADAGGNPVGASAGASGAPSTQAFKELGQGILEKGVGVVGSNVGEPSPTGSSSGYAPAQLASVRQRIPETTDVDVLAATGSPTTEPATDAGGEEDEGSWGWGTQDDMMRGGLWGAGGGVLGAMMLPEDREEEEEYESSGTPPWQGRVQLGGFSGISPGGRERRYFGRV